MFLQDAERELNAMLDVDAAGRIHLEFECQCGHNYHFVVDDRCCFFFFGLVVVLIGLEANM